MFGIFKTKDRRSPDELLKSAEADIRVKWVRFNASVHLQPHISLAERIDIFAGPIHEFLRKSYPSMLDGSAATLWFAIFTAVMNSGTHTKADVNAAVQELRKKYVREPNDA